MARATQGKRFVVAAAAAAVLGLGAASPTLADKGGIAHEDSCG